MRPREKVVDGARGRRDDLLVLVTGNLLWQPERRSPVKKWSVIGTVALWVCLAGCSLYRDDRQYIWDSEYQKVRDLYDRCGSIQVVEQVLHDRQWTRGQVNEVRYRLMKDYSLDESGVPRGIDRPRPSVPARLPVALGVGPGVRERRASPVRAPR